MVSYKKMVLKNLSPTNRAKSKVNNKLFLGLLFIAPLFIFLLTSLLLLQILYRQRIYPKVFVAKINLSGLTEREATQKLASSIVVPGEIKLKSNNQGFKIPLEAIEFSVNFDQSSQSAYHLNRLSNPVRNFYNSISSFYKTRTLPLSISYNKLKLDEFLSVIAGQIYVEPVYPSFLIKMDKIIINPGRLGEETEIESLRAKITKNLSQADWSTINIPTRPTGQTLTIEEMAAKKARAEKVLGKKLVLKYKDQSFEYEGRELIELAININGSSSEPITLLGKSLAKVFNRERENPTFIFEAGLVKEFKPGKDGLRVVNTTLTETVQVALERLTNDNLDLVETEIPIETTSPDFEIGDINNLGIKELIGSGKSKFKGSISSRMHNIGVASKKFNSTLVAPGETLSFNQVLGDVSVYTGYRQAYIIKDGQTVLGDGGGVCQVSTTLFRAALDAGLPIIERRAHSYRVSYYEQDSPPGLDATIYAPTTDLKIKNDTPGHLLIQTVFDPSSASLVFNIYGTSDGRTSSTSKPQITNSTPPPKDLYLDDPHLPLGTIKQIDWKAWGAKVQFDYQVERDGKTIFQKTFYSNFRPWQAKYLRGTGGAN